MRKLSCYSACHWSRATCGGGDSGGAEERKSGGEEEREGWLMTARFVPGEREGKGA